MSATTTATSAGEVPNAKCETRGVATAMQTLQLTNKLPPARDQDSKTGNQPSEVEARIPVTGALLRVCAALAAAVFAIYAGYRWWTSDRTWVKTDNAYVAAHIHTVSARVAGSVKEVLVDENQEVALGSVLARLDPSDFEVKKQQALAQVAQAKAQSQRAEAQISQARAEIAREQAGATKASQDFQRAQSLYQGISGAISKQEFDQAKSELDAAEARLEATRSVLGSASALAVAAQAQEEVAQANLHDAELQLSYTEITAPAAGRIGKKNLETGNRVQPGQALVALVQPDVWVTANFKETQLARLKPGQLVYVEVDALPGRMLKGKVDSLSPASGAQFALLPPDNATGNFTKIVQRVPVKIVLDAQSVAGCEDRIVPGLSAVVEVKVRE
jgi:membrane fusion protein, multidrug efflux system